MQRDGVAKEIKAKLLLSEVVKDAVALRGRGTNFLGLCPFHEEKTPSFHVRDHLGRFKCFGCGASGDVFEFVMRLRGLGFTEAVQELSGRAGIVSDSKNLKPKPAKVDDILHVQKLAQSFFQAQLRDPKNASARRYVQEDRGLSEKMIVQAGLGFGGSSAHEFIAYLKKHGVRAKQAVQAGLVKETSFAPQFLGRITFPIRNFEGDVVAFGGRSFLSAQDNVPKYVNTHSYEHFEKRKSFFGVFESKKAILRGKPPIIVEGYFDAMALWALGKPALALCGTALSKDHSAMLQRFGSQVILCFDADEAGFLALKGALIELLAKNINVSLLVLLKKDPGAYLSDRVLPELLAITEKPKDAFSFLIERSALSHNGNITERLKQIDFLLPIFKNIKRPLLRRQYVAHLAHCFHEDPSLLWSEIERELRSLKKASVEIAPSPAKTSFTLEERLAIAIVFACPALFDDMSSLLAAFSPLLQKLLKFLAETLKDVALEERLARLQAAGKNQPLLPHILLVLQEIEFSEEEAKASLLAFKKREGKQKIQASLKKKRAELKRFEQEGDFSSVLASLKEQSALLIPHKNKAQAKPKPAVFQPPVAQVFEKPSEISDLASVKFFEENDDWI